MSGQSKNNRKIKTILAAAIAAMTLRGSARADIFEWYLPPILGANYVQSATLCVDGAGVSPAPLVDLSGRNLRKAWLDSADLTGANLSNTTLDLAYLRNANLTGANLQGATLAPVDFSNVRITGANLRDTVWTRLGQTYDYQVLRDFHGMALGSVNLNTSGMFSMGYLNLSGTDFTQTTIPSSVGFTDSNIYGANFAGTGLTSAQLYGTSSYKAKNLGPINLSNKAMTGGWKFDNQSMASASFRAASFTSAGTLSTSFYYADLPGADFSQASFSGGSFYHGNFQNADFTSAVLRGTTWGDANFSGASFRNANLSEIGSYSKPAIFTGADFTGATVASINFGSSITMAQLKSTRSYLDKRLIAVRLTSADFSGENLSGGVLARMYLENSNLDQADLRDADLRDAVILESSFNGTSFRNANCAFATLRGSFVGTDFTGANLSSASLSGTLDDARLTNANLRGVRLSGSLRNMNLRGVDLTGASLRVDGSGTNFADANITGTTLIVSDKSAEAMTSEQFYSTANYKNRNLRNMSILGDAKGWDFSNQDLTDTSFGIRAYEGGGTWTDLADANFTNARIAGGNFTLCAFNKLQLVSTASYQQHNLLRIRLGGTGVQDWTGLDFSNQDLNGAEFLGADLSNSTFRGSSVTDIDWSGSQLQGVDFTLADLRGSYFSSNSGAPFYDNAILSDATMNGLHLSSGDTLVVRDISTTRFWVPSTISVRNGVQLDSGSKMQLRLHDNAWRSTLKIDPAISIQLGGTLELDVDSDAIIHELIGTPIAAFNWNATLSPENRFEQIIVDDRFVWDTSNLYSTGVIEIVHLRGDANDDGQVNIRDLYTLASNWKVSDPLLGWDDADFDGNGSIDALDLSILAKNWQVGVDSMDLSSLATLAAALGLPVSAVPEPASLGAAVLLAFVTLARRWRGVCE